MSSCGIGFRSKLNWFRVVGLDALMSHLQVLIFKAGRSEAVQCVASSFDARQKAKRLKKEGFRHVAEVPRIGT